MDSIDYGIDNIGIQEKQLMILIVYFFMAECGQYAEHK